MKMTVLFDDDAGQQAGDALNALRDLQRRMRDEQRRKSNHTPKYRDLEYEWDEMATELTEALLAGAVIWQEDAGDVQHPG